MLSTTRTARYPGGAEDRRQDEQDPGRGHGPVCFGAVAHAARDGESRPGGPGGERLGDRVMHPFLYLSLNSFNCLNEFKSFNYFNLRKLNELKRLYR